jgi:hypothetical protein
MFQTKAVDNVRTNFMFSNVCFFRENRAVYEIMWKYVVEPDRPQMTVWRMRVVFWMTMAADTHLSTATMVVRTRPNVTFILSSRVLFILITFSAKPLYVFA